MGFWQGVLQGYERVQDQKERVNLREDEKKERELLRKDEREYAEKVRAEDKAERAAIRAEQAAERQRQAIMGMDPSLLRFATRREAQGSVGGAPSVDGGVVSGGGEGGTEGGGTAAHYFEVLRSYGADDEVIAKVARGGLPALQQASEVLAEQKAKFDEVGSQSFTPDRVNSFLNSAIITEAEDETYDFAGAAELFGLNEADLNEDILPGISTETFFAWKLSQTAPGPQTTFTQTEMAADMTVEELNKLEERGNTMLSQALVALQQDIAQARPGLEDGDTATAQELADQEARINDAIQAIDENGNPAKALEIVGPDVVQALIAADPRAATAPLSPMWTQAREQALGGSNNTIFDSEEAVQKAYDQGLVKPGDTVTVNGQQMVIEEE